MNKIVQLISKKYADLIFGLFCGINYFVVTLKFILDNTKSGGMFLAMIFFPMIVCGIALVFVKLVRQWLQEEKYAQINTLVILHLMLFLLNIVLVIGMIVQ